jgi:hypothetical protein
VERRAVQVQAPPLGVVVLQSPIAYDASNLYLYASNVGLTGVVWIS